MSMRAEQRDRTRTALLHESRRLFAAAGYADVGLAEVVTAAGVTKGALYHHFPGGKADLFRAVLAQVQDEVGQRVAAAADAQDDPWDRFTTGCRAFLGASTAPDVERIMLVDGPAVLGWTQWRAMDAAASGRHLVDALTGLVAEGVLAPQPVAPLAHLLSGAMNELALWLAGSGRPEDRTDADAALSRLLAALRVR